MRTQQLDKESTPFLTNNLLFVSFSPLPHTAYKHLARWKALNLKPFQTFLKCGFLAIGACAKKCADIVVSRIKGYDYFSMLFIYVFFLPGWRGYSGQDIHKSANSNLLAFCFPYIYKV